MTVPYRPCNGTAGELFMARFCNRCRLNERDDCDILSKSFCFDVGEPLYPVEWVRDSVEDVYDRTARCTAFQDRDKPAPVRDVPGQLFMFEAGSQKGDG